MMCDAPASPAVAQPEDSPGEARTEPGRRLPAHWAAAPHLHREIGEGERRGSVFFQPGFPQSSRASIQEVLRKSIALAACRGAGCLLRAESTLC